MKNNLYCKIGAIFTLVIGTLLHFTYDFFGESDFTAIFSAVNESTWEHLKLLFFPVIIFAIIEYFVYGKNIPDFWAIKVFSLLVGMLTIITVFYTYTGIIGKNFAFADISIFVLAVIITYWLACRLFTLNIKTNPIINKFALIISVVLFALFWIYTFNPPLINLFKDPVTGGYGI